MNQQHPKTNDVHISIDTSDMLTARVSLLYNGSRTERTSASRVLKSQMVLPLLEELLSEHGLSVPHITSIDVHTGPGSFTGLRVGITVANMLGKLLNVPVNGSRRLVTPQYS